MKNKIKITLLELVELLNSVEKGTFINLMYEVSVRMNKTNNPYFGKVFKQTSGNFGLGNSYTQRVKKDGTNEGHNMSNWTTEKNKVGQHISKVVLQNPKTGEMYLQLEVHPEIKPTSTYIYEGNVIDQTLFQDYRIKLGESKKQPHTDKTIFINLGLKNIKEISLNGERYYI